MSATYGRIDGWLEPATEFRAASWLFIKALALIYVAAFASLAGQIAGLAGPDGLLPVGNLFAQLRSESGPLAWVQFPNLFWLGHSDSVLTGAAWLGCAVSLALLIGLWERACLVVLFALYLSLTGAGQVFLNFQWDYLLLEAGFLAIFLAGGANRLIIFLFHWLLFRLRFESGVSKLASGDSSWADLSALQHYFETQPLPHVGAWYAHQLPDWLLSGGVLFTYLAELVVPFFIFLTRPFRLVAAAVTLTLQLLIIATSNHNFFNLLTIALCLFLLDDDVLRPLVPKAVKEAAIQIGALKKTLSSMAAVVILSASVPLLISVSTGLSFPESVDAWSRSVRRYGIGHAYHVFPTMQVQRIELEIEGSADGIRWETYPFKWKPGPLNKRPAFIVPHQPRLDWMMWFVPAKHPMNRQWFEALLMGLWHGNPKILALLGGNPFDGAPPRYLRVRAYRYHFTTPQEREMNGNWWKREYLGEFPNIPPRIP